MQKAACLILCLKQLCRGLDDDGAVLLLAKHCHLPQVSLCRRQNIQATPRIRWLCSGPARAHPLTPCRGLCVVSFSFLANPHEPEQLGTCLAVRSWLPAPAWQVGWVVTWHRRAPSSPALPSRASEHRGPAGTITLPAPEMKMDWPKWSIRAKNKLEIRAQAILAKSCSVHAGRCPMGGLGAPLGLQKPPEQTVCDISFGSAAISLLSWRISPLY